MKITDTHLLRVFVEPGRHLDFILQNVEKQKIKILLLFKLDS